MFIFLSRFRFAAVKNGNHCFCLSQIQENSRVNQSLCNLRLVLKLTSSSDISSIDYEKIPQCTAFWKFSSDGAGRWGVIKGYKWKSRQEGQNIFFNDHEVLVERLFHLFIFSGLFN